MGKPTKDQIAQNDKAAQEQIKVQNYVADIEEVNKKHKLQLIPMLDFHPQKGLTPVLRIGNYQMEPEAQDQAVETTPEAVEETPVESTEATAEAEQPAEQAE